ncbi:uncharacterized protein LOC124897305 [Capsicum annuum]|uniref:uncharacterized protein LOC124897305 n=1 Tax=Capsicum annuum TaxID=4072 RepID=UPI001FB123CE|nr:uncharacterized protein LOC124897305 [Capsicum annuum]
MLKQLTMNVPLVEALEQVPGFTKFMKDLLMKKRAKKPDPGAFTIPCTVGSMEFAKAICDLEASINMMPLSIYKKLGLGAPTPTNMQLVMVDRSVKRPDGILHDVLVKVFDFILPVDFVVLDCDVDFDVPIILGREFLAIIRVIVDIELNKLKFRVGEKTIKFEIHSSMVKLKEMSVFSIMDVFHEDDKRYQHGVLMKSE